MQGELDFLRRTKDADDVFNRHETMITVAIRRLHQLLGRAARELRIAPAELCVVNDGASDPRLAPTERARTWGTRLSDLGEKQCELPLKPKPGLNGPPALENCWGGADEQVIRQSLLVGMKFLYVFRFPDKLQPC